MKLLRRLVLAFVVPIPLLGFFYLPRYWRDWLKYRVAATPETRPRLRDMYPCLTDWTSSTPFDPHYLYQGAWLARRLYDARPAIHVDVGSSVSVLSVISAYVPTIFVDYRPLHAFLPNLSCVGGSILSLPFADGSVTSLSCLHVIEHIGLGRYGDPLDANGARRASVELQRVVAAGGKLYLTTPIGHERVCFNAHRVFAPETILSWFSGFQLVGFSYVSDNGVLHENASPAAASQSSYACGFFEFRKSSPAGNVPLGRS